MNFIQLALSHAFFAIGESRPNPAVGAVVVKDGIVVGKGRTQRPGSAHAEVMALRDAGELARGAAIFVTLEPCCHYGRTPPCTKAIIDAGIKQVYFAHSDPNPVVRGKSRRILEEAGLEVFEGVEACIAAEIPESWGDDFGECHCLVAGSGPNVIPSEARNAQSRNLNGCSDDFFGNMVNSVQHDASVEASGRYVFNDVERYYEAYDYFVRNKRTFVEVKCAVSQEGFMGMVCSDGSHAPLKITGEGANCWNHELRAMSDAVLVGAGTLLADNPGLDVRYAQGNNPVKVVWTGHHEFTAEELLRLKVFSSCLCKERNVEYEAPSAPKSDCASRFRQDEHCLSRQGDFRQSQLNWESDGPSCKVLVFSCVPQPALSKFLSERNAKNNSEESGNSSCCELIELVFLDANSFSENWLQMLDDLTARGMHRLMVEPGAGLAAQLFSADAENARAGSVSYRIIANDIVQSAKLLWNRLDLWLSTDCSVERSLDESIASGSASRGLEFPGLPENVVAKESAMVGPDVLTVYYNA